MSSTRWWWLPRVETKRLRARVEMLEEQLDAARERERFAHPLLTFSAIETKAMPEGQVLIGASGHGAQVWEQYPRPSEVWRHRTTHVAVVIKWMSPSGDLVSFRPFPGDGEARAAMQAEEFMGVYERLATHAVRIDLEERVEMTVTNPTRECRKPEGEHCPFHDTMKDRPNG